MHDVMVPKEVMLLLAMSLSLDKQVNYPLLSGGVPGMCLDQPRMDPHPRARGHALDQSTLHTQTPERQIKSMKKKKTSQTAR